MTEHVRRDNAGESGGRRETRGRSEKAMEKRRMRKAEEKISKGRTWEREIVCGGEGGRVCKWGGG